MSKNTKEDQKTYEHHYVVYTDGSGDNISYPYYGGSAFVILDEKESNILFEWSKGYKETTSNRCEIIAFIEAIKHIKPNSFVTFNTDSQYCKTVLNLGYKKYPKNMDLINEFRLLCRSGQLGIKINWVKSHSGHKWNEYVDKMANNAYKEISGLPVADWKGKILYKKKDVDTLETLTSSIIAHLQYRFDSDADIQAIFDSIPSDEIIDGFLDWALNNIERIDNFKI